MKSNIFKLIFSLLIIALLLVGCSEHEGTIYSGDTAVYAFAGAKQKVEMLESDGNKFIVPVYRGTTQGNSTLDLTFTLAEGSEGLFTLSTPTVTFEDGQSVAEAIITYEDVNALGVTDLYKMELSFDEAQVSPTNVGTIAIEAQRKLTFKLIGEGEFTSEFFGDTWPQPIEKAEEADVYRLIDCYASGYNIIFGFDEATGTVTSFATQETGYNHSSYGMVSVDLEDYAFENNTLSLMLEFTVSAGSFGPAIETFVFPTE